MRKEPRSAEHCSMDGPRGRDAKRNKPVTEGQILLAHELSKIVKFTESESGMVAVRGWGCGSGKSLTNGHKVQSSKMNKL